MVRETNVQWELEITLSFHMRWAAAVHVYIGYTPDIIT